MHNRDIALIRLAITVSILRDQVVDPMFAEFGLKMECNQFSSYLTTIREIIENQKIDVFDHAAAGKVIYEVSIQTLLLYRMLKTNLSFPFLIDQHRVRMLIQFYTMSIHCPF